MLGTLLGLGDTIRSRVLTLKDRIGYVAEGPSNRRRTALPFPSQSKGRTFTRVNIEALNPNEMGVYALYNSRRWVYVGSGEIRQRLLDHLTDNPCITSARPTHWVDETTDHYIVRKRQLIRELGPLCNQTDVD